jgi:hypothetical protein
MTGGLLVDLGVLTLKPDALPKDAKSGLPHALPSHPAIVEWRAMTVIELYIYFHFSVINLYKADF